MRHDILGTLILANNNLGQIKDVLLDEIKMK